MPKRRRPQNMTAMEAFRMAMKRGRQADRALAEARRFAQIGYDQHGPAFLEAIGAEFTVDDRGRVHMRGEHRTWANGYVELEQLADAVENHGWTVDTIAACVAAMQATIGHEPAAAVLEVVRELADPNGAGRFLQPAEVAARLRQQADRVEQEAAEAERLGREGE